MKLLTVAGATLLHSSHVQCLAVTWAPWAAADTQLAVALLREAAENPSDQLALTWQKIHRWQVVKVQIRRLLQYSR